MVTEMLKEETVTGDFRAGLKERCKLDQELGLGNVINQWRAKFWCKTIEWAVPHLALPFPTPGPSSLPSEALILSLCGQVFEVKTLPAFPV